MNALASYGSQYYRNGHFNLSTASCSIHPRWKHYAESIFAGLHNTWKWGFLSLKCQVCIYQLIFGMLQNPDNRPKRLKAPSIQTTRWRAFKAYIPREIFTFLSDGSIEMHCPIPQEHLQRMPRTTSLALHWTSDKWNSRTECQINGTLVWTLG